MNATLISRRWPAAFLGGNSRRGERFLDAGCLHVARHVNRERQWGCDGASLELASGILVDPISYDAGDFNLYRYVFNNPIRYIDPSGLKVYWCVRDMDGVFLGNHHFIKVVPDTPNDFKGQLIDLYGGEQGMTLGGFKGKNGCLEYQNNNQGDLAGTREANDPKRYKGKKNPDYYKSGWDVDCHEITPPGGMTDTQFIQNLLNGANNFAGSKKKCKYKLGGPNCASWVNSLLESVGVPKEDREKGGEFGGTDWGEEECCPNDMFK